MKIRQATLEDIYQMSEVFAKTWKVTYKGIFSQRYLQKLSLKHWVEPFKRGMQAKKNEYIVAQVDERIVGGLVCGKNRHHQTNAQIYAIYVLPEYQGLGIGKALIEKSLQLLHAYDEVDVFCVINNYPARQFYTMCGFQETNEIKRSELDGVPFSCVCYRWKR